MQVEERGKGLRTDTLVLAVETVTNVLFEDRDLYVSREGKGR